MKSYALNYKRQTKDVVHTLISSFFDTSNDTLSGVHDNKCVWTSLLKLK